MKPPDSKVKVTPGGKSTRAHTADDPDYKYPSPRTLQIVIYQTKSAQAAASIVVHRYVAKARSLLAAHRLSLRVYPQLPSILGDGDLNLDWTHPVENRDHFEQIKNLSQKRHATPADALPVICTTVKDTFSDNGEKVDYDGRPFVFLHVNKPSDDGVTLLHEMGHAAGIGTHHPTWGLGRPDKRFNFMATPAEFKAGSKEHSLTKDPAYYRNTIFRPDVVKLAESKFSVAMETAPA